MISTPSHWLADMSDIKKAYRRSIWDFDDRYAIEEDRVSPTLLQQIGLVQSIEAAKKRTPPIPIGSIIQMIRKIENLPDSSQITQEQFEKAIKDLDCWGARTKTVICILSVLKNGRFPPLDWKIARAARLKKLINENEERSLNGNSNKKISEIYVNKVLPQWLEELNVTKNAKELDNNWGNLAESS